jgi:hypothetical protein
LRFSLQSHQQIHDLARIGATIEQVAQAHEMRVPGCPLVPRVEDAGLAQQPKQFVMSAVHVGECDYAIDSTPLQRRGLRSRPLRAAEGDGSDQYGKQVSRSRSAWVGH